jgi:hypothetical protein
MAMVDHSFPMQVCAGLSCLASGSIILLFIKYKELLKTIFTKLIFYIAICDFFSSVGIALGFSSDGTIKCWIQGILTNIFPISGVFWTTVIAYLLTTSIFQRQMVTSLRYELHLFCWCLPICLTFFPLTTNAIGTEAGDKAWCFLKNRSDSPSWSLLFWTILSFYFWIWSSIILFCSLFVAILYESYRIFRRHHIPSPTSTSSISRPFSSQQLSTSTPSYATIRTSLYRFGWYPLNVILCWSVTTLFDILKARHKVDDLSAPNTFSIISDCTPGLLGLLNVIAFIVTNAHIRSKVLSVFGLNSSSSEESLSETQRRQGRGEQAEERSFQRRYDPDLESDIRPTEVEVTSLHSERETVSTRDTHLNENCPGVSGSGSNSVWTNPLISDQSGGWRMDGRASSPVSEHSIACFSDGIAPLHQRSSDQTVGANDV